MITKDESKSNDFISILNNHFQGKVNLSRALCNLWSSGERSEKQTFS